MEERFKLLEKHVERFTACMVSRSYEKALYEYSEAINTVHDILDYAGSIAEIERDYILTKTAETEN